MNYANQQDLLTVQREFKGTLSQEAVVLLGEKFAREIIEARDGAESLLAKLNTLKSTGVGQTTKDKGEIFNDYENNVALAEYTHVSNMKNRAGHCGYKMSIVSPHSKDVKKLYIFLKDEHLETPAYTVNGYKVGDLLNFSGRSHYQEFLKIEEIFKSPDSGNSVILACIIDECPLDSTAFTMETPDNEYENWVSVTNKNVGEPIPLAHSSHAEGENTVAIGRSSHSEGRGTIAIGSHSHTEGKNTKAGYAAHAEGQNTYAIGDSSHAEGNKNKVYGGAGHAEGSENTVTSIYGHAEGWKNTVSGKFAHAEGCNTKAIGYAAHTEGDDTTAEGIQCHSEGYKTVAKGGVSHSEGAGTIANGYAQHVQGKYNVEDRNKKYAHIVGNGSDENNRSNAHTLDWDGNAWFAGTIEAKTIILRSPNGSRFNLTVSDEGKLNVIKL